eukprot:5583114-Prymnesium_polylepis.1
MRALGSFNNDYLPDKLKPGNHIVRTTDACTVHGCVNLVHADKAAYLRDYEEAQRLMDLGLFEVKGAAPAELEPAAGGGDGAGAARPASSDEAPLVLP